MFSSLVLFRLVPARNITNPLLLFQGNDSAVYHKSLVGSTWNPGQTTFDRMGGVARNITAVSWDSNRIDMFIVGQDSSVYQKFWSPSAWSPSLLGYNKLAGGCRSSVAGSG